MKKAMIAFGVLMCATLLVNPAAAGDCTREVQKAANEGASCSKAAAEQAKNDGSSCSKSAAKAAYAKALDESGCERTAQVASNNAMAENVYAASYAKTSCSKTAQKAAYDAVYDETSCEKSSNAAATHAVAKAKYDATLAETGCEKSAKAAYASMITTAGSSCATATAKAGCDKGAERSSEKASAEVKMASKENG